MSRTITQEQIYRVAQPRAPNIQAPAQPQAPVQPQIPILNPVLLGGLAGAQGNVELNRRIREEAKARADEVYAPLYNRRPPPGPPGGEPEPPGGGPGPEEEKKEEDDDGDERRPLLGDVDRIIERHPPPPGVAMQVFREFITEVLAHSEAIGRYADSFQKMLTSATLIYHLWTERGLGGEGGGGGSGGGKGGKGGDPRIIPVDETELQGKSKDQKKIRPLEERMMDPIPPQCFRHIYKDEKGQLRTLVICKTDGHAHRFYHDA